jgi:hypothetical protein
MVGTESRMICGTLTSSDYKIYEFAETLKKKKNGKGEEEVREVTGVEYLKEQRGNEKPWTQNPNFSQDIFSRNALRFR